jgi:hypothetical protein
MNKTFNGYRTHQTYIERVNNFMLQVTRTGENEENGEATSEDQTMEEYDENNNQQRSNQQQYIQRFTPQQQQQYQRQQQMQQQRQQQQQRSQTQRNQVAPLNTRQPQYKQLYPNPKLQQQPQQQMYSSSSLNDQSNMIEEDNNEMVDQTMMQQAPPQMMGQKPKAEKRKITTSDLRNKRNQIQNHSYSGYSNDNTKRVSYSVKMAIGSGGYQADSL